MHSKAVKVADPVGVIDFNAYLGNRSKKAQLESWLENKMKEELKKEDVSSLIDNPFTRISTKFDALSYSRQKEILEYVRENIMMQKENLHNQLWSIMASIKEQESALEEMEAFLDHILIKEHVCQLE